VVTCWLDFGQVGLVPFAGTHPLARNNQFLPYERDFRGCGFISARLELSGMPNCSIWDKSFGMIVYDIYRKSPSLQVCLNG
jgi:hypothetical protein